MNRKSCKTKTCIAKLKKKDWNSLLVMYTKILRSKIKYCFETKANLMVFSVIWQKPNTELMKEKLSKLSNPEEVK